MCYAHFSIDYTGDVTTIYTGSLRPFPGMPDDGDGHSRLHMEMVLKDCASLGLTPQRRSGADFEDFWEDAYRASAAVRACTAAGMELRLARDGETVRPYQRLGPVSMSEEGRHRADELLMPESLQRYGGRLMARAWVDTSEEYISGTRIAGEDFDAAAPECPDELFSALRWVHTHGASDAVVKLGTRKGGVSQVRLSSSLDEIRAQVYSDEVLAWSATPDAAPANGFLVQEWVPMEYEYRVFIVDGTPVTGAGCVEEFTPLDRRDGEAFDTRVRRVRGNGVAGVSDTEVVSDPHLVAEYQCFARAVAIELPKGHRTVVMDVATDARNGNAMVVEFNTLPNSGLYASDVYLLHHHMVRAKDRGYGYLNNLL